MSDGLRLLLCSRELLGEVLNCIAEEAALGDRGVEESILVGLPHIRQVQPEATIVTVSRHQVTTAFGSTRVE